MVLLKKGSRHGKVSCVQIRFSNVSLAGFQDTRKGSRLEHVIGFEVPKDHPVSQWLACWLASLLNRVAVKSHGRTVFEHSIGHRMKNPLCTLWKAVLFRTERHFGAA